MERAGRLIGSLKLPKEVLEPDALARIAWPAAVGKKIAVHTQAVRLVRSTLLVECEDQLWQSQVATLSAQVLENLRTLLGPGIVTKLDFRPMVPRRGPQTAVALRSGGAAAAAVSSTDEADRIPDAVFRHLYKKSRRTHEKRQMQFTFDEAVVPAVDAQQKKVSA